MPPGPSLLESNDAANETDEQLDGYDSHTDDVGQEGQQEGEHQSEEDQVQDDPAAPESVTSVNYQDESGGVEDDDEQEAENHDSDGGDAEFAAEKEQNESNGKNAMHAVILAYVFRFHAILPVNKLIISP